MTFTVATNLVFPMLPISSHAPPTLLNPCFNSTNMLAFLPASVSHMPGGLRLAHSFFQAARCALANHMPRTRGKMERVRLGQMVGAARGRVGGGCVDSCSCIFCPKYTGDNVVFVCAWYW